LSPTSVETLNRRLLLCRREGKFIMGTLEVSPDVDEIAIRALAGARKLKRRSGFSITVLQTFILCSMLVAIAIDIKQGIMVPAWLLETTATLAIMWVATLFNLRRFAQ
jgi:hypothetical protein